MKRLFLIIIAAVFAALAAAAQDARVRSFEAAHMDVTAQKLARLDLHGEKCALVKVQVIATGLEFSGNVMGDVAKHGSEYWVYMTDGTKMLKITADTFLPMMYYFPEPLRGGVTYVLTLEAPSPYATAPASASPSPAPAPAPAPAVAAPPTPVAVAPANDPYAADTVITKEYWQFRDSDTKKFGYKRGDKVVIPPQFDNAWAFSEGIANVCINGKRGYIDKTGTFVLPAIYDEAFPFNEGVALVKIKRKYGFIDKGGKVVIPATFDEAWSFSEGMAMVKIKGKYGYIDRTGTLVIPAKYDYGYPFAHGKATVRLKNDRFNIDRTGKPVKDTPASAAPAVVVPSAADDIANAANYETFRDPKTKKYGYKYNGQIVIPAKYDNAWNFSEGLARVTVDGKKGFIDGSGAIVIPATYHYCGDFHEGRAVVEIDQRYGYIDRAGNLVITPQYTNAGDFSDGLAWVSPQDKAGYIDLRGAMVIPAKYDGVWSFSNGRAKVRIGTCTFFIDRTGKEVK